MEYKNSITKISNLLAEAWREYKKLPTEIKTIMHFTKDNSALNLYKAKKEHEEMLAKWDNMTTI